jgi:hypothetical protein
VVPPTDVRRSVSAVTEPRRVDLVVATVLAHVGQRVVDRGEESGIALRDGEPVLLAGGEGLGDHELVALRGPVGVDREVLQRGGDVVGRQGGEQGVARLEGLDRGPCGRVLVGVLLTGRTRLHADGLAGQIVQHGKGAFVLDPDEQRLVGVEVRVAEVDLLGALVGDGHGRRDEVAVAGFERGDDGVEGRHTDLEVEVVVLGNPFEQFDVEARVRAVVVLELERGVGDVGAHGEGAVTDECHVADVP